MNRTELISKIREKQSFLCVGLDSEYSKLPKHLLECEDPVFEFNKQIIDATHDLAVAYKPNLAFYESNGVKGWISLQKTMDYLRKFDVFSIADAKRGDIGNTSSQYAKAFLDPNGDFNFDSLTIAPYMGEDSVSPFLVYPGKFVILLALTSNKGANDFQFIKNLDTQKHLFEEVLEKSKAWGNADNMMYVVGATQAPMLANVRKIVPDNFLLIPGVGSQGGSLADVCKYGMNKDCGLLVNASRSILFASSGEDFAVKARAEAQALQQEMKVELQKINL